MVRWEGPAPVGSPLRLYLLMRLGDVTKCGIAGGEFRIEGIPEEWFSFAEMSQPDAIAIGNPIRDGAGFGLRCTDGEGGLVPLYDLLLVPTTFERDLVLRVTSHRTPSNPSFLCPLVTSCDGPVFTQWCVEGGWAVLNPERISCTSAVAPGTWTQVKSLYRK